MDCERVFSPTGMHPYRKPFDTQNHSFHRETNIGGLHAVFRSRSLYCARKTRLPYFSRHIRTRKFALCYSAFHPGSHFRACGLRIWCFRLVGVYHEYNCTSRFCISGSVGFTPRSISQVTTITQRPILMALFGALFAVASIVGPLIGGGFAGTSFIDCTSKFF